MNFPFLTASKVPPDPASATSIRHDLEVDPASVGVSKHAVAAIWQAVENLYRSGVHPAIQICVRRRGEVLLDRAIGYAAGNGPGDGPGAHKTACTTATPFNIFSASKAITAMVIHLLDQRRIVHLDDHVCDYIPEFGRHRKEWITIRHVLTHRAGIPNVPPEAMRLEQLEDSQGIIDLLCNAEPISHPGRAVAYHALTGGFVLGEVARRATGKSIGEILRREISAPLGFEWMTYGTDRKHAHRVARSYFTGFPVFFPVSGMMRRALGVDFDTVATMTNDERFLLHEIPSGNVVATAHELSRFYQLLLNGGSLDGVGIFEPRTIRRATAEQSYFEMDTTLGLPFRYSMGFMLGAQWFSLYGPDTEAAYGHLGFSNIVSWADPERQVAGALLTSGKPFLYPALYHFWDIMRQIGVACPKEPRAVRERAAGGTKRTPARPARQVTARPAVRRVRGVAGTAR